MKPSIAVFASDLHLNSRIAMCPTFRFRGNAEFYPHRTQRALYARWKAAWDVVRAMKKDLNAELHVHVVGDILDNNKHDGIDPISRYSPDITELGLKVLQPIAEMSDYMFLYRGTEAHDGAHGALTEELATDMIHLRLPVVPDENEGYSSWGWFWGDIGGVSFEATHHPKSSSRIRRNRAAVAARQQSRVRDGYLDRGDKPPDVGVYAHNHFWADSGTTTKPRVFLLPPWHLCGAFGDRLGSGGEIEPVGLLILVCRDGVVETVRPLRYEFKRRRTLWKAPKST
ncbi:MAG TPA: hypothetical protein VM537_11765 [Anaerolineae bacterium]|nr:hypothetical protein [Anaerolineae bacterium]